jgi:putative oxidoreductase
MRNPFRPQRRNEQADIRVSAVDIGLLYLRVAASLLLLIVHGLPKLLNFSDELDSIADPFHLGKTLSVTFAIFAQVVCPSFMMLGIGTRMAAIPILLVTLIAIVFVHPDWTLVQGQFAWMLLIMFGTVAIAGPGKYRVGE